MSVLSVSCELVLIHCSNPRLKTITMNFLLEKFLLCVEFQSYLWCENVAETVKISVNHPSSTNGTHESTSHDLHKPITIRWVGPGNKRWKKYLWLLYYLYVTMEARYKRREFQHGKISTTVCHGQVWRLTWNGISTSWAVTQPNGNRHSFNPQQYLKLSHPLCAEFASESFNNLEHYTADHS